MTLNEAYNILGLSPGTEMGEVKRRYRRLIRQVHPDAGPEAGLAHPYPVHEINLAYEVLKKEADHENTSADFRKARPKASFNHFRRGSHSRKQLHWDAPVNEQAYREREIFCWAESQDGERLGMFSIGRGKYLWKIEEEFSLFLRSVYQCGKEILDEIDASQNRRGQPSFRQEIQARLTFLLAQQFIDSTALLQELAGGNKGPEEAEANHSPVSEDQKDRIFYLPAMLEAEDRIFSLKEKESLYPSRLFHRRLYVKNQSGKELGYLSFLDDRLYYVVVPLFEQRRVRIKLQAAGDARKKKGKRKAYHRLHLWIKLTEENPVSFPENLNLQIQKLLEVYGGWIK